MSDTLYENYNDTTDNFDSIFLDNWGCQTFTPSIAHTITSVKLKLLKVGSPTGTMYVYIQGTSAGKPDGVTLCTGTYEAPLISSAVEADYEFTLGVGASLSGTMYAIVSRLDDAAASDSTKIKLQGVTAGGGGYAGGAWRESADAGTAWSADVGGDHQFYEYGIASGPTNYDLVCNTGTFTLTGNAAILNRAYDLVCNTVNFILNGIDILLERTGLIWTNQSKSTSISPTNLTKNSISLTNQTKNNETFTNATKNSISPTNSAKSSATFSNLDKS